MDILTQLNSAMAYIEDHIANDLALADVSTVTAYSPFHFGRLFYYIADMPLSEYIRKRKLSLAAIALQSSDTKVIDLAIMYGYDSADSFTRAFVKQHGVTPSAARQAGISLTIFPPLTFQITIKGVQAMNWRIEEKEAFEVFGAERVYVSCRERTHQSDEVARVQDWWAQLEADGTYGRLCDGAWKRFGGESSLPVFAAWEDKEWEGGEPLGVGGEFLCMICALKQPEIDAPPGFQMARIAKATWAVFRSEKSECMGTALEELFHRAYQEWMPSSGYTRMSGPPDMEVYYDDGDGMYYDEAWIPVVKTEG